MDPAAFVLANGLVVGGVGLTLAVGPFLESLIGNYEHGHNPRESFSEYLRRCIIANGGRIILLAGGIVGSVFAIEAVVAGAVAANFTGVVVAVGMIGGPVMIGVAAIGGMIWSAFHCYNRYYIHKNVGGVNFIVGQEYTIGIRTYWFFDEGCNWYWLTLPNGNDVSMERFENDRNALSNLFTTSLQFDNGITSAVITILGSHITVGIVPAERRLAESWYDASDPRRGGRYGTCSNTCIYDTPGWNCYFKFRFIILGIYTAPPDTPSPSCSPSSLPWNAEGDYCAICLNNNSDRILPCGHHFHRACISEWFSQKRSCPCCGRAVPKRDII